MLCLPAAPMHRDHDSARAIALLEASLVGHLLLDGELRCVWLNAAAATLAGTTVEQALGRHIGEVLPQLTPSFEGVFRTVLDTALPFRQLESRVLGPGGVATDRRWIASAFPVQCAAPDLSVGVTIVALKNRPVSISFQRSSTESCSVHLKPTASSPQWPVILPVAVADASRVGVGRETRPPRSSTFFLQTLASHRHCRGATP